MRTGISWLDIKLGFRMLVKYPGLTLVGGLAMAFAIAVGTASFEFLTQMLRPTLPLDDGDRVVGIRLWDAAAGRPEEQALHDFFTWREELESVEDLGAFRTLERNLITGEGRGEPVTLAEMTASGFRMARVPPLLGRALVEADEQSGTAPVVVLGYDVWQRRFGGDPAAVGQTVRLGSEEATVVGVMPEGFAFPVSHDLWVPFRLNALSYERGQGPAIRVVGRLAPGATRKEAQAELTTLGRRAAADFPETHEHLRPQVLPYANSILDVSGEVPLALFSVNLFLVMLLVLVCGNVALLMFARAATRESEIVVRNALGASRGRIIGQLFAEALVLGGVAVLLGLAAAGFALQWWLGVSAAEAGGRLPFWFSANLSPATVLYAILLTLLGAAIAGVVPALKLTRGLGTRLRQASAGGGGLRLGGVWTAVIVAQVAVTVAFPATAFFMRREVVEIQSADVGFPAGEYLSARLELDLEPPPGASADIPQVEFLARFGATYQELERRLEAEPAVVGVTFADRLPRTFHPQRRVEVEEGLAAPPESALRPRASSVSVAPDYFEVLGAPILSGRGFHSGDLESDARVVIVNQSFVAKVLGDRNPIGRHVRFARPPDAEAEPWYEIVGVVRDLGMVSGNLEGAGFYLPAAPGEVSPLHLAIRVRGEPEAFAPRLRAVAAEVDPSLRLHDLQPLDEVGATMWLESDFLSRLLILVSAIALLLSLAGIYSVMSFTVSRRTREIGIRVALGADRRRVIAAIFRRPLAQVGLGILGGGGLVAALMLPIYEGALSARHVGVLVAYVALMLGVCLLACIVPTQRALRIEPTEALRADG